MQVRTQWGNLAAVYKQFNRTTKKGFEGLNGQMSDYNAFIQANTNVVKVYVPKSVRLNGGSVLAPYQITRGSLPSIVMTKDGNGILVSDIALGALVIGAGTTVGDFTNAVVSNNPDFVAGDQITFFYGTQRMDAVTGIPRAKITGYKVVLDPADATLLMCVVAAIGFTSVDGYLGMSQVITDGAAAWIHTREDGSSLRVSTQFLYVDSTVLASYQGDDAFGSAADSYGGINTSAVYLQPAVNVISVVAGGGSGSGSSAGGGSASEPSETPVTVAAPQFSGETQFTESTSVTMTGPDGATIYYTTDGSVPSAASGQVYSEPVTLTETTTVKAVAVKDGVSSSVTERTYTKGTPGGMDQN